MSAFLGVKTLAALALLALPAVSSAAAVTAPADAVFVNGHVVTLDEAGTVVQAVAVRDGRIVATGGNQQIRRLAGPQTEVVDLRGRPLPVLRGEGVERQIGDAQLLRPLDGAAHRFGPALMPRDARQAPGLRPAAVAVHDDRDVPGRRRDRGMR